jgi:hypothetical protein
MARRRRSSGRASVRTRSNYRPARRVRSVSRSRRTSARSGGRQQVVRIVLQTGPSQPAASYAPTEGHQLVAPGAPLPRKARF